MKDGMMVKVFCTIVAAVCLGGWIGGGLRADGPAWQFSGDSAIVNVLPLSMKAQTPGKTSLLAVSASGAAYRFDIDGPAAGKPVWQAAMKGRITGIIPVGAGKTETIVCCDASGLVTSLSAATGLVRAARAIASTPQCALRVTDGNKSDETIFIGCQNSRLYSLPGAIQGSGGKAKFFRDSISFDSVYGGRSDGEEPSGVRALITITDILNDRVCALALAIGRSTVRCISPASLRALSALSWVFSAAGDVHDLRRIPDIDQDGISDCAVTCGRDSLYLLSGKTGTIIWRFQTDDSLTCFVAAPFDGKGTIAVVIGDRQGKAYCVLKDKEDAGFRVAWVFDLRDGNAISAIADFPLAGGEAASGFVVGAQNNRVYVLSTKGKKLWSGVTGGTVLSLTALPGGPMDEFPFLAVGDDGGMVTLFHPNGITTW